MSIFDLFRKKKPESVFDALMDIPEIKAQKELYDAMSEMNKGGCTTDEMPDGL